MKAALVFSIFVGIGIGLYKYFPLGMQAIPYWFIYMCFWFYAVLYFELIDIKKIFELSGYSTSNLIFFNARIDEVNEKIDRLEAKIDKLTQ